MNARRARRDADTWAKRTSAAMFYRLFNTLADHPIPSGVGDFRLLDRDVVDAICEMGERSRFDKAVYSWVGFETTEVEYDRLAGAEGDSHWPYRKLWKLALAVSIQKCASVRFTSCVRMFRKRQRRGKEWIVMSMNV